MKPIFFAKQSDFRKWFVKNHKKETELVVGFYKVGSGKPSITWSQSVDEALCFGWIDSVRKSIDGESYCIRFTPRNPKSIWSAVNIKKAEELIKLGLMQQEGLELYKNRKVDKAKLYSYENKPEKLPPEFEQKFKANKTAWEFFSQQPSSYKRTIYFWILSAKQERTQLSKLGKAINESEQKIKNIFR
ncbi:MAG: YdeI/OmpD-associated family protein [Ignavibacteria bacterium]|nr:YdeI/OmpD-associated family protein [Ignavibacteria bacterium]